MLLGWLQQDDIDMGSQDDLQKLDGELPGKCAGTNSVFGMFWRCGRGVTVSIAEPASWCCTWPDHPIVGRLEPLSLTPALLTAASAVAVWPAAGSAPRFASAGTLVPGCLQAHRSGPRAAMPLCPLAACHRRAQEGLCPL